MLAHIAIAVADLDKAAEIYVALGFVVSETEVVERECVQLRKATKSGLCLELIAPFPPNSGSVSKYLAKRGPGLHHVALYSEDLRSDLNRLEQNGIHALSGYPAGGSGGSVVAFLNPHTTGGVLIELVQLSTKEPSTSAI